MSIPVSKATTRWRIGLIAGGVIILIIAALIAQHSIKPPKLIGIAEWLIAAVIVHDAIIAPFVFGTGLVLRKAGRRIPLAVLAIVQGGLVVGAIFTIVLVPEILAQRYAELFTTLLPFDYVANLGILWVGTLIVTGAAVVGYLVVRSARSRRLKNLPLPPQP